MTVGTVNNWANLNVTGTITPAAVDSPSIKVGGVAVGTSSYAPTPEAAVTPLANDADGTEIATAVNAIVAALVANGILTEYVEPEPEPEE
jgi:hypothetical protein